jgi:hypothetical protein
VIAQIRIPAYPQNVTVRIRRARPGLRPLRASRNYPDTLRRRIATCSIELERPTGKEQFTL